MTTNYNNKPNCMTLPALLDFTERKVATATRTGTRRTEFPLPTRALPPQEQVRRLARLALPAPLVETISISHCQAA